MCSDTLTTPRTTIRRLILASTPAQTDDPSPQFIFTPFPPPSRTSNVRREVKVKTLSTPPIDDSPIISKKIAVESNLEVEIQQLKAQLLESSSLRLPCQTLELKIAELECLQKEEKQIPSDIQTTKSQRRVHFDLPSPEILPCHHSPEILPCHHAESNRSEENSLPEKKPYQTARLRLRHFAPHEKCSHRRSLNNTYPPASLIKRASSIEEFLSVGLLTP